MPAITYIIEDGKAMDINIYKGFEFPAGHYFFDKFVLFVGTLERCSRRDASDRLFFDCGGVPVERIAAWVKYVVAGNDSENIDAFREAKRLEQDGHIIILTEQEFFDTMDGTFTPPPNPNKKESTAVVYYPPGVDWKKRDAAERAEFLAGKRDDYLRKRKPAGNKYDVRLQDDMKLRFDYTQMNMMWAALERWGVAAQVSQTIEECAELIVALNKHTTRTPSPETHDNVVDEIADLEMMLAQMRLTFGISDEMLAKRIKRKFSILDKYLKKGN
jgi:NTP pyrophosphatase (non-canonical NTP hydrolase)